MNRENKIPVTIVTGFLGAGKTTFINSLLKKNTDTQFALVENEFGEVAIDTKIIDGMDTSQMFELKQGCICCSINDEYELVLQELAERFPDVDHLLIETTGVADPAPILQPFFSDENLQELYDCKGTICLIDALNFEHQPEKEISLKQLAIADLVLVSKAEKLEDEPKRAFVHDIQKVNPFAEIQYSTFGEAQVRLGNIQGKIRNEFDFRWLSASHAHIQTKTLRFEAPQNRIAFCRWLEYTLDVYKNQIYRCKGIVCFQGEPFEYILQGVGGSYEITEGDLILESVKSQLVFIGKLDDVNLEYT